jgi:hypothetical protein
MFMLVLVVLVLEVGGCWEDDAKRSVRHNNQISGVLELRYVPKYFYLSTHKVHTYF